MENEKTIQELLNSLNNSMEDIREHPTKIDRIPSNFEIMVRGISDSKAIDILFSPKIDELLNSLFKEIESGNFEKILSKKDSVQSIFDSIFGNGAFRGPISNSVLNNIQGTVQSQKYQALKSHISKAITILKKKNLILKNLDKGKKNYKRNSDEYKKYNDAIYAIKNVIKFAERIYRNRRIINKKVYNGLNNLVHESLEYDEMVR